MIRFVLSKPSPPRWPLDATETVDALTDLEAAALGCIRAAGACTAYTVRAHFRASPSARFSDSAGSVYPMVERLRRRGLLRARAERQGRRRATVYECTPDGLKALRRWIAVPEDAGDLATWDPLRTRVLSLGLLPRAARLRWVERAQQALAAHADAIARARAADTDASPWLVLAHRNAELQVAARRRWLAEVRAAVEAGS